MVTPRMRTAKLAVEIEPAFVAATPLTRGQAMHLFHVLGGHGGHHDCRSSPPEVRER